MSNSLPSEPGDPQFSKGRRVRWVECGCWKLPWKLAQGTTRWTDGRDSCRMHGAGKGRVGKLLGRGVRLDTGPPES